MGRIQSQALRALNLRGKCAPFPCTRPEKRFGAGSLRRGHDEVVKLPTGEFANGVGLEVELELHRFPEGLRRKGKGDLLPVGAISSLMPFCRTAISESSVASRRRMLPWSGGASISTNWKKLRVAKAGAGPWR